MAAKPTIPKPKHKLSCFLPWVAKQYDLDYKSDGPTDPACVESQGDPLDEEKNICTTTPSFVEDLIASEQECIFPFYYLGNKYEQCVLFDESGFVYPVFRCPTRNVTTTIDGISNYPSIGLTEGLCPMDNTNASSPLDPNKTDCFDFQRRGIFKQCKNNCPGGKYKLLH
jgi:hypothetical protein